jgi:hypothetical protein
MHEFAAKNGQMLYYVGDRLEEGARPTIFYFALSAKESLLTDPFNQMVEALRKYPVRIFSVDLPFHGDNYLATEALKKWAEQVELGIDPLTPFFEQTESSIEELKESDYLISDKVATAGLSRGAFVAVEMAHRIPWMHSVLGFAPLTQLKLAKEFHTLQSDPITYGHSLTKKIDTLLHKKLRFYISNRDMRVGTKECFDFIYALAEKAHEHRVRSPAFELVIKPPIGHLGHGTSKETFEEGALWLLKGLGLL